MYKTDQKRGLSMDKYLRKVSTLKLNKEACISCGKCIEVCPHEVFKMKCNTLIVDNTDSCMECGACLKNCPVAAISVRAGVGCVYGVMNNTIEQSDSCC
jgi:ferredoxin